MSQTYNDNNKSISSEYKSLLIDCNNTTQLNETTIIIPIIFVQQSYDINNNNDLVKPYIRESPNSPIAHAPITAHVACISQINKRSSINYIMFLFWISIYLFSVYIGCNI